MQAIPLLKPKERCFPILPVRPLIVQTSMTGMNATIYPIDPLRDPRWSSFVDRHPRASIFHTTAWIESLVKTYGYRAVAFTSNPPNEPLSNGTVCCLVKSWLTGRRLVSLPFSDHCEPLVNGPEELNSLLGLLTQQQGNCGWKYVEIRPRGAFDRAQSGFSQGQTFYFHSLDLRGSLEDIYRNFHKDCVQRKIRRAEREGLRYEEGNSEPLLKKFYHLQMLTRRRHHLPPQPVSWFRNLMVCLGGRLKFRVASKDSQPIASILTLQHKSTLVYKYGCSDAKYHNLGGMPLLFWKAIQEAKQGGLVEFDFGRSDCDNPGLVTFKDHWGTARSTLTYLRYPAEQSSSAGKDHRAQLAKKVFAHTPNGILSITGKLLYRHMG